MKNTFLFLVLSFLAISNSVHAQEIKSPCPNGYEKIRMELISEDLVESLLKGGMSAYTTQLVNRIPNGRDIVTGLVHSAAQVRQFIESATSNCRQIRYLSIVSHGNLGTIAFPNSYLDASNIFTILKGLKTSFSPNAAVRISGCNVARGCLGRNFLYSIAKLLFQDKGKVIASTQFEMGWFRIAPMVPVNLLRREMRWNNKEKDITWLNGSDSCQSDISKKLAFLEKLLARQVDAAKENDLIDSISFLKETLKDVDLGSDSLLEASEENMERVLKLSSDIEERYQIMVEKYGSRAEKIANIFML